MYSKGQIRDDDDFILMSGIMPHIIERREIENDFNVSYMKQKQNISINDIVLVKKEIKIK